MNRPFTAHSPYSLTPTERIGTLHDEAPVDDLYGSDAPTRVHDYGAGYDYGSGVEYDADYDEYADSEHYEDYDEAQIDRRWMWIGGIAGVILFIAVVTTGVILGGGDSGSVKATIASAAPSTTAPATASATPSAAPTPSLPAETVTTVSPTAAAPTTQPTPTAAAPPAAAAPPPAAASPRTITYRVTGNRSLIDLVTVIYTDQQGALQTDVNVALPWAKTVTLDPGVELKSVTATSLTGQLNCSITDAAGALISVQNNNTMIANCTQ
jgi:hypothetical protein